MSSKKSTTNSKPTEIFVSLVCPVSHHQPDTISGIKAFQKNLAAKYENYEVILVDNTGLSTPTTLSKLLNSDPNLRLLKLARPHEIQTSIFAGLEQAIGDYVIVAFPESDPASIITRLLRRLYIGHDIVISLSTKEFIEPVWNQVGSRFFYWYTTSVLKLNHLLPQATSTMGLNRKSLNALTQFQSYHRHLRFLITQTGFQVAHISYAPKAAPAYRSSRNLFESVNLALNTLVTYSRHPLRAVTWIGLLASLFNLGYILYVASVYFLKDQVAEGWTTSSIQNSLMFLFLFLSLAIISEYIGRILEETQKRPPYTIVEELTGTTHFPDHLRRNIVS